MKNPIFVALDVDDDKTARKIASETAAFVGGFKIGPRLVLRYGSDLTREFARLAPVFVDCKFHDIPSSVVSSVESAFAAGASFATVHASNGVDCLREVARIEKELSQKRAFRVLAVTVLTSFNENNLPANWRPGPVQDHVIQLAGTALEAGLTGLVCSPLEVAALRAKFPGAYLVTPGIRPANDSDGTVKSARDDQARTMTPAEALRAGANALVIGRPIVAAANPGDAAEQIASELSERD